MDITEIEKLLLEARAFPKGNVANESIVMLSNLVIGDMYKEALISRLFVDFADSAGYIGSNYKKTAKLIHYIVNEL